MLKRGARWGTPDKGSNAGMNMKVANAPRPWELWPSTRKARDEVASHRERVIHSMKPPLDQRFGGQAYVLVNLQGSPSIFSSLQTSCSNSDPTFILLLPAATVRWYSQASFKREHVNRNVSQDVPFISPEGTTCKNSKWNKSNKNQLTNNQQTNLETEKKPLSSIFNLYTLVCVCTHMHAWVACMRVEVTYSLRGQALSFYPVGSRYGTQVLELAGKLLRRLTLLSHTRFSLFCIHFLEKHDKN